MVENNRQTHCPKCHAPLPLGLYEETGSRCPSCGLVFFKYRAAQNAAKQSRDEHSAKATDQDGLLVYLMSVPETLSVSRYYAGVIGFVLFAIWGMTLAALDVRSGEMNHSFLHGPLLVFHEAGHVIFRPLGEFFTVLGGTLGQLLMPLIMLIALLRHNRDTLGAALALWFIGVSLLDIAPYAYDALQPQLILLNGDTGEEGGHDWIYLLRELGILKYAHVVGRLFYLAGVMTLFAAALWAALLLRQQKKNVNRGEAN